MAVRTSDLDDLMLLVYCDGHRMAASPTDHLQAAMKSPAPAWFQTPALLLGLLSQHTAMVSVGSE